MADPDVTTAIPDANDEPMVPNLGRAMVVAWRALNQHDMLDVRTLRDYTASGARAHATKTHTLQSLAIEMAPVLQQPLPSPLSTSFLRLSNGYEKVPWEPHEPLELPLVPSGTAGSAKHPLSPASTYQYNQSHFPWDTPHLSELGLVGGGMYEVSPCCSLPCLVLGGFTTPVDEPWETPSVPVVLLYVPQTPMCLLNTGLAEYATTSADQTNPMFRHMVGEPITTAIKFMRHHQLHEAQRDGSIARSTRASLYRLDVAAPGPAPSDRDRERLGLFS